MSSKRVCPLDYSGDKILTRRAPFATQHGKWSMWNSNAKKTKIHSVLPLSVVLVAPATNP